MKKTAHINLAIQRRRRPRHLHQPDRAHRQPSRGGPLERPPQQQGRHLRAGPGAAHHAARPHAVRPGALPGASIPEVDILLLEPTRDDLRMFSYNIMRYSAPQIVAEHGYRSARAGLPRSASGEYRRMLRRHGIGLRSPTTLPGRSRRRCRTARRLAPLRSPSRWTLASALRRLTRRPPPERRCRRPRRRRARAPAPARACGGLGWTVLALALLALAGAAVYWRWSRPRAAAGGRRGARCPGWPRRSPCAATASACPTSRPRRSPTLVRAQGYVTAQDRLWQMDLLRRRALGELAEAFGEGRAARRPRGPHPRASARPRGASLRPALPPDLARAARGLRRRRERLAIERTATRCPSSSGCCATRRGPGRPWTPGRGQAARPRPRPGLGGEAFRATVGRPAARRTCRTLLYPHAVRRRPHPLRPRRRRAPPASARRAGGDARAAATTGWSPAPTPRPACRCSPTTRTSASACPRSGPPSTSPRPTWTWRA